MKHMTIWEFVQFICDFMGQILLSSITGHNNARPFTAETA